MRYVTRWRMHVAATGLREENATVADVADRLGHASEATFSRALQARRRRAAERGSGGRGRLVGQSETLGQSPTLLLKR